MFKLILYNILKHRILYLLIGSIVMLLAFYLVIGMNAVFSFSRSLVSAIAQNMTGDVIITPKNVHKIDVITKEGEKQLLPLTNWQELVAELSARPYVKAASARLRVKAMAKSKYNHIPIILTGIDPEREKDLLPGRILDSGRWLKNEHEINLYYRHSDQLSIDDTEPVGLTVPTLDGYSHFDTAVLTGRLDYKDIAYYSEYAVYGFITLGFLNKLLMSDKKLASEVLVRLQNRGDLRRLKHDLKAKYGHIYNYFTPARSSRLVNGIFLLTHFIIYFITAVLFIMVIISCSFIVSLSIETRRQEIGIYQAIGVKRFTIGLLLGGEFLVVMLLFSLAGSFLALAVMSSISQNGIRATIIPLHLVFGRSVLFIQNSPYTFLIVFGILFLTFMVNVIYGVKQLGRLDPVEVMREL